MQDKMKYRLIFSDFDGTLIKNDLSISERNAAAVRDYVRRGGTFVVCTGRMSSSIDDGVKNMLGIADEKINVVGFGGAHIADSSGNTLWADTVAPDDVITILRRAGELGIYYHTYHFDRVLIERENKINLDYFYYTHSPLEVVGDLITYVDGHRDLCYPKIMTVVPPERMEWAMREFGKLDLPEVQFHTSSPTYLEFVSVRAGKGTGLRRTAELLGIPLSETIAVGDNMNDIAMIREAGLGAAVGNALPSVKAEADYIAPDNESDPIADIIEKFCGE